MRRAIAQTACLSLLAFSVSGAILGTAGPGLAQPSAPLGAEAPADFNCDGNADLAIGVPSEDVNGQSDAGGVSVIYGGSSGLQTSSPASQFWSLDSPDVSLATSQNDQFGDALGAGDFNNDGCTDLAIGLPNDDSASTDGGAVIVLYGRPGGLQAVSPDEDLWNQLFFGPPPAAGDQFGSSLTTGNFDGDNFVDLAIGVPGLGVGGAVDVVYGGAGGLGCCHSVQTWTQGANGVDGTSEAGDGFGSALASGDFNDDSRDDLGIGAPGEDIGTTTAAGGVNVIYGSAIVGLQTSSPADDFWSQDSSGINGAAAFADLFGSSLAGGDFNGDLRDDLAIGVPSEDVAGVTDAGSVNVIYGGSGGLQVSSPADDLWTQESSGVNGTAGNGDSFGLSLVACFFNSGLVADLAVGVPGESVGSLDGAGAVNVLFGGSAGLQTSSPADQLWTQDSSGVEGTAEAGDSFGRSLTCGDIDEDFFDDLTFGAPFEDVGSTSDAGSVNVIYGGSGGLQTSSPNDQLFTQDSPGIPGTAETNDHFGWDVAAGAQVLF
jgi:hypothetical protein